ncbi:aminopeptidase N [Streptomyces sp. TLI_171]|uniref:aminopeptidase N n=1 Tax=Streptomyces sp. TLI_171 TaxID=1938859 RepID=UPI000C1A4F50|nr:aminopeptidase N [Streptomyces sp. TLI_171]RKE21703.1 membrane alanyl aminopeptidase [Streptomyces sp. TLI_171]
MPALQRSEATVRARLLEVRGYTVDLDLTRGAEQFGSTTVIRFGCAEPGSDSFVDLEPAVLHRAVLNGQALDVSALDGNRLALPGLRAENELVVEAEMRYSRTGEGLHRYTDPADDAVYLYATCGPDLAAKVFACFDQPDLKAPITLTATAPPEWTLVSNGARVKSEGGHWEFAATKPISSYLFTVVAGPLHSVFAEHDGIPLGLHARRSLAAELDREAAELFEVTAASLDRLHQFFDERYPFGEYHQAFVPEFNWGAMENPGCVVFRDEMLFRDPATAAERERRAMVVCHEMAHMWFGDLVTMRWWDDLWLNESFAEMLGYRIAAEATRFTGSWTGFSVQRKGWGYDADQRGSTHPVAGNGTRSVAEAMVNFDGISYAKGASVLRQLVAWLGDEAFFAGLNAYFADHLYGNAELPDFLAALAASSGRDVHAWADAWLRTSGVDTLRAEAERAADGTLTALTVVNEGERPHLVRIGGYRFVDGRAVPVAVAAVEIGPGRRVAVPEPVEAGAELIVPNDGDLSWAKIRLDAHSWRLVTESLSAVEDDVTRAVLWEHARDLVRDAELDPVEYLALMERHLPAERCDVIVETVLGFARTHVAGRHLTGARRTAGLAAVSRTARALLATGSSEGIRLAALRTAVESSGGPEQLAELRGWLAGERVPAGLAVGPELRWAGLARLAALGELDEAAIAAELAREPGTEAEFGAARCRAALPDAEAKAEAWQRLFDTDTALSNRLLEATARGFWTSGDEAEQARYALRYFERIGEAAERGDIVARLLGTVLYPVAQATSEAVAAAEAALADPGLSPALRRNLADATDDLRRTRAVRAAFDGS